MIKVTRRESRILDISGITLLLERQTDEVALNDPATDISQRTFQTHVFRLKSYVSCLVSCVLCLLISVFSLHLGFHFFSHYFQIEAFFPNPKIIVEESDGRYSERLKKHGEHI